MGNITTAERPSVSPYAQESLTRRDVTSLAAPKNKAVKICKDALTAVFRYSGFHQFLLILCLMQPAGLKLKKNLRVLSPKSR
jgi:hypothetical protein